MLTELQAEILGVNPNGFQIIEITETPALPDVDGTMLNLLVGRPNPTGKRIPQEYLKELKSLGLNPVDSPFLGGLLPICQHHKVSLVSVLNQIDKELALVESFQDYQDYQREYWEIRWLAFHKPETQSLTIYQDRINESLKAMARMILPPLLQDPNLRHFIERQVLVPLGSYAVLMTTESTPAEPVDEWQEAIELNWLYTLEARAQTFEKYQRKLKASNALEAWQLVEEIELLRPPIAMAERLLVLEGTSEADAALMINQDTYEYCVARVCEQDHNHLLGIAYSRALGILNVEEDVSDKLIPTVPSWT